MFTHFDVGAVQRTAGRALVGLFVLFLVAAGVAAQKPHNISATEESVAADDAVAGGGVFGYKSVRRINPRSGGPAVMAGDTLEWTIDYVNFSSVGITNFNIRDQIGLFNGELTGNLTFVAGSNVVTLVSGGATAVRNTNYDGIGNDSTSNLLAAGATLPVGGRIQVRLRTTINMLGPDGHPHPDGTILYNQTLGIGTQLTSGVLSDAIDATNTSIFGIDAPPAGSLLQLQNPIADPTIARIKGTTSADITIEGEVRTANGEPIANALVTALDALTGQAMAVRTDEFGRFSIDGVEVGSLITMIVQHKRYRFLDGQVTFSPSDSVTGLAFIGRLPETKPVRQAQRTAVKAAPTR